MSKETNNPNKIGIIGTILGLFALGMAIFHFWYGPIDKQPALEDAVAEQALKIKDRVIAKLKGDKSTIYAPKRKYSKDDIFDFFTLLFGFSAIMLAVVSFIKREDKRACGSAVLLGVGAITFQFLTVALGIIIFVVLVAAVLGSLGLS